MAQPYIGEIRMFAGNFAPNGWMFCEGQALSIAENDSLFTLIGTTYGGDGETTFNLPDLRGRLPIHFGSGDSGTSYVIGESAGTEQITLNAQQIPAHSHNMLATTNVATTNQLSGNIPATMIAAGTASAYGIDAPFGTINADTVFPTGGSQPHTNLQPYLCGNFIISLFGV